LQGASAPSFFRIFDLMNKIALALLCYLPITCLGNVYLSFDGGMYAAHWKSAPIFQKYTPSGTPEGGAWRATLGYRIDPTFSIEAAATYFDKASRTLNGNRYTIRQKSYSFLFGIRSPELFWHYRAYAKFGFAHFQAELSGLNVPFPIVGDIHFPTNTLQAFRPAYFFGLQQKINNHFFSQFGWYHIDGEANVASNTVLDNVISVDQNIPSINIFMGGITYQF